MPKKEILISPIDNRDKILLDLGKDQHVDNGPLPSSLSRRTAIPVHRKPAQIRQVSFCRLCRAEEIKEAGTKVLASQLFLDCRARRSG